MSIAIDIGGATVKNFVKCSYDKTLNGIADFEIMMEGASSTNRATFDTGAVVNIYRNGTLEIKGEVFETESYEGGGILFRGSGHELELTEVKCPVDSGKTRKTYLSTDDHTIITDLVTTASGWTVNFFGSVPQSISAFRTTESMSVWQAIAKLLEHTKKDIEILYSSKVVRLHGKRGTANAFDFSTGKNVTDVRFTKKKPVASKVIVYGKGDGAFQYVGTAGSGTPVKEITDRNLLTQAEVDVRAQAELDLIQNSIREYTFTVVNPLMDLEPGDQGTLTAGGIGLDHVGVDIVRVKRGVDGTGTETLDIDVTNPEYRLAKRNRSEFLSKIEANQILQDAAMTGSGNTMTWAKGINAKNGAPLAMAFELGSDFIQDEAGNILVDKFLLDYDLDPYRRDVADAVETQKEPSIDTGTVPGNQADDHDHNVRDPALNHTHNINARTSENALSRTTYVNTFQEFRTVTSPFNEYLFTIVPNLNFTPAISSSNSVVTISVQFLVTGVSSSSDLEYDVRNDTDASTIWSNTATLGTGDHYVIDGYPLTDPETTFSADPADHITVDITGVPTGGTVESVSLTVMIEYQHAHDIAATTTVANGANPQEDLDNPDLSGKTALHDHDVVVGDDVDDRLSLNSTQVDIYVDFWNGASWTNKHSILATGMTLDRGVDLSNSGTLPDAAGWWRIRIEPDSSSPDLVQARVTVKHHLDD